MPETLLLHSKHQGTEVTYQPVGPWLVPWRFDRFEAEYQSLRTAVGLIDYSTQALLELRGADRADFLHRLLTNDIKRLAPGAGCDAALLNASAKLIAPLLVLADAEALWLMCELHRAEAVARSLDRYRFSEEVSLTNHERRNAVLALQGPRTIEFLTSAFGTVIALPHEGDHCTSALEGIPVRLIRQTLTGQAGVLLVLDAGDAERLWKLLSRRGRLHGLQLVGWEALNTARIEAGLPWWDIDMTEENLLAETGLERIAVSETKGCYLGQEVMARLQTYGSVSQKLMGLLIEGHDVPQADEAIVQDGEPVGRVTSACRSPALDRPIGMGYLKRGAYEPGRRVEIVRGERRLAATVASRPMLASSERTPADA